MATSAPAKKHIYMRELSAILDRSSHTIRGWERDGLLLKKLLPHRDEKGWRYWTPSQVVQLVEWMKRKGMQPGKGLAGFEPTEAQVESMMQQLRQPRDIEAVDCEQCGRAVKNLSAHMRLAHPS